MPYRVITVWEPDIAELLDLEQQIQEWRRGGPKPRISAMSLVQGAPLQSIRLAVGEFTEPYRLTDRLRMAVPPQSDDVRPSRDDTSGPSIA